MPLKNSIGEIHDKGTLFFIESVGTIKNEKDEVAYELSRNVGSGELIIRSKKTGKWFSVGWMELLNIAQERGIDDE